MARTTKSPRPLIGERIEALEAYLVAHRDDPAKLRVLEPELAERHTARAGKLRDRLARILAEKAERATADEAAHRPRSARQPSASPKSSARPPHEDARTRPDGSAPHRESPGADTRRERDAPARILDAWTALEVLSPQSFRRPADLAAMAGSEVQDLIDLSARATAPWEGAGQRSRPDHRLYYQVVLGTVRLEPAVERLLKVYEDRRPERHAVRGEAVLASVLLDRNGRPVEPNGCAVSSFGWGLPQALLGDLGGLGDWPEAERDLLKDLDRRVRFEDEDGETLPVTLSQLATASRWLVETLGIDGDMASLELRAIKTYQYYKLPDAPEPLLLNSFYLEDLGAARALATRDLLPATLKAYLGAAAPASQQDLLKDGAALFDAVRPARTPTGRWPSGPRSLVLLQQAAVNASAGASPQSPILGVNGPPGTGKTTLLRDVVAAQVTSRALAMAAYDDPAAAFGHAGQMRVGQSWLHLYTLEEKLRGFEMLVASSNNKAVENVSAELPALDAVDGEVRYFASIAEHLLERPCWGLAAAVLGKGTNRARFRKRFWFDDEAGLRTYLAEAAGTPQWIETLDAKTGKVVGRRKPKVIAAERPPEGPEAAARRWRTARRDFLAVHSKAKAALAALEEVARAIDQRSGLEAQAAASKRRLDETRPFAQAAMQARGEAEAAHSRDKQALDAANALRSSHGATRPGLLARLFRTQRARTWSQQDRALADQISRRLYETAQSLETLRTSETAERQATEGLARLQSEWTSAVRALERAIALIEDGKRKLGPRVIDDDFFERSHHDRQMTTPWLAQGEQDLRQEVFAAAMALHRAFIDAAAKPLRHNIGALMSAMSNPGLPVEKQHLLPHLWSSLFLVTPVISTTFASVSRMLGALPSKSLGWLLIDEAGQALPQAAVGGLMRAQKAVVVGDPIQVEPVVTLPESLTGAICKAFDVDPDRYNAPAASAQTLADRATPFASEFETREGSRRVGAPLLVHRRCAEPMFGISNAVAYNGLMVQAKRPRPSAIADLLGPSRWLHIESTGEEKWSPREGEIVVDLLKALQALETAPDVYIVTPFVTVQDHLRALVLRSRVLERWPQLNAQKWVYDRIGTVHTVQGREAEAVIFVLGAPEPAQRGARGWAGGTPNLLNVAVSRAQEALYVVGNRDLWREAGVFSQLHNRLPD